MRGLLFWISVSIYLFGGTIQIAVASNLSFVIEKLIQEFHLIYPNIRIKTSIGSSGTLTAQILHGAPYQLFLSADMEYPDILFSKKIAPIPPVVYAKGEIALLSRKEIELNGLSTLRNSSIRKIAIANPKIAPYGRASVEALTNSGIWKEIRNKIVYGESISQTLIYTLKVTDIGIVAKSALFNPKMKNLNWVEIDTKLYTPISQGMVVLNRGFENSEVWEFYNFILSNRGQEIFREYGYGE